MPISGAKFTNQIAICKHLLSCRYRPDVIMGSSGGCITGMLLLVCDVASVKCENSYHSFCDRLYKVLDELDSSWYMSPWSYIPILNTMYALGSGSLFNRGGGADFMNRFPVNLSAQPEMWIGTRSQTHSESQLFCTKHRNNSIIQLKNAKYMNCDTSYTVKASTASCAVYPIVPPVTIDDIKYIDGGISHASPLGPCMTAFDKNQLSFHIVYVSPVRYSSKEDPSTTEIEDDDVWSRFASSTTGMVSGLHIPDRNNGIRAVGPNARRENGVGKKGLMKALKTQRNAQRSFIELAPLDAQHLNFVTMAKGEATKSVKASYEGSFSVRHWIPSTREHITKTTTTALAEFVVNKKDLFTPMVTACFESVALITSGANKQSEATLVDGVMSIKFTHYGDDYVLMVPHCGKDYRKRSQTVSVKDQVETNIKHHPGLPVLVTAEMLGVDEIQSVDNIVLW